MITEISIEWSIYDVIYQAQEFHGMVITKSQASSILQLLKNKHDAAIGINWDVIDVYLDDLKHINMGGKDENNTHNTTISV